MPYPDTILVPALTREQIAQIRAYGVDAGDPDPVQEIMDRSEASLVENGAGYQVPQKIAEAIVAGLSVLPLAERLGRATDGMKKAYDWADGMLKAIRRGEYPQWALPEADGGDGDAGLYGGEDKIATRQ
ncbi:MAG: hypothetical protein IT577_23735 [Verrucomicrobiae bacterium]|nr:hypothetical protein [Verrucomicrobiae bacterium]